MLFKLFDLINNTTLNIIVHASSCISISTPENKFRIRIIRLHVLNSFRELEKL
jgi:hypothetical protein